MEDLRVMPSIKTESYNQQQFPTVLEYIPSNGEAGYRCVTCKHEASARGMKGCCQPALCGLTEVNELFLEAHPLPIHS